MRTGPPQDSDTSRRQIIESLDKLTPYQLDVLECYTADWVEKNRARRMVDAPCAVGGCVVAFPIGKKGRKQE